MGSCLGTEKGDPSLAPWKGPKGLYPGEKFFSGKCHGARTVTLSGTCCANGCGAACEAGAGHVCGHQPCPGHTQERLKWGPCSRSTWRWGQQGWVLPLPGWCLGPRGTLSAAVGTLVCTGRDLVSNVGYFMQFDRLVPVSLCVVFQLNKVRRVLHQALVPSSSSENPCWFALSSPFLGQIHPGDTSFSSHR